MSDETPPPSLRLKPRQRPESETPPAGEPAAAQPAESEEGKLRLKPKLTIEPEPEPEPAAEEVPAEAEPEVPAIQETAPEAVAEPPAEPEAEELVPPPMPTPEEGGKFKLKIKLPGAAQDAAEAPAEEEAAEPELPPFPVVAPPPPDEEIGAPPLLVPPAAPSAIPARNVPKGLPPGGSRPAVFKRPRVPAALLAAERRKRIWKYALIAVGGVILAAGVIGGAFLKFAEPPPPVKTPPRPTIAPVKIPVVPPPVVEKPPPPPVETAPVEATPGVRVATTATVEIAPGVTAQTEMIKAVPNAGAAFKSFVASAKISGVFQGTPPRAFINGRLVHTGEMIDDALEIYFDSVDLSTRSIVFKDSRGATVSRRY